MTTTQDAKWRAVPTKLRAMCRICTVEDNSICQIYGEVGKCGASGRRSGTMRVY